MNRAALLTAAAAIALIGCAGAPVEPDPALAVAPAWQAPLPHDGRLGELDQWWAQFDDPMLARLVAAAEGVSPTIASAGARIAEARASRVGAEAALLPTLGATASAGRGRQDLALPVANTSSAGLQASWELDVFGGNRAGRDAAEARLEGAAGAVARRARHRRCRDREPVHRPARLRGADWCRCDSTPTRAPRPRA